MMNIARGWDDVRRVLCIRLDSMGDVIMTGPAIRALKESGEGRQVTLMTSVAAAEAATRMPCIDEVLTYTAPWMKADLDGGAARDDIIRELRARRFDGAVIFTLHTQSPLPAALLCWFAGIPLIAARCRENPYHLLTTWAPEDEGEKVFRHDVERQLSLVAAVGAATLEDRLSFCLNADDRAAAAQILESQRLRDGKWCLLHPGASAPSRRYPAGLFAAAARSLIEQDGWTVLITGGESEQAIASEIRDAAGPGAEVIGPMPLGTLAALIESAPVLIANNSGPAHLAAAVGTPVVDLYALTNPQHAPWGVPHRLLYHDADCKFCYRSICPEGHHRCLALVDPEEVAEAARELARAKQPEPIPVEAAR
jgi:lipopolysaccharide heptosyltransferase II